MIRSIRYITLLVLLQFVTGISVLYAQSITSASGIVRDSVSGEPLSYVSVMFENSTIGATMTGLSASRMTKGLPGWSYPRLDMTIRS